MANGSESSLDAALDYARRGWFVFPVFEPTDGGRCTCNRSDCDSPAKHPRTRNGFKAATTDELQIRQWWGRWPQANVGIATGVNSDLVVIDIDPRNGGNES